MDIALIIISSFTFIVTGLFLYLYLTNENKNKVERITSFNELRQALTDFQTKYSEDSYQSKLEANKLKEQMQIDLQNILKEIKAPLDLD